jgi:hypothetical protein
MRQPHSFHFDLSTKKKKKKKSKVNEAPPRAFKSFLGIRSFMSLLSFLTFLVKTHFLIDLVERGDSGGTKIKQILILVLGIIIKNFI